MSCKLERKGIMESEARRSTVACIVTEHDQAVIEALGFLRRSTISDVVYAWTKLLIDEAEKARK